MMEFRLQPTQRNDTLKLIALLTMLIDHIGYLFYPDMMVFRTIGRIAFPIFAYQLAVGYRYTGDLKKYSLRLLGFALISMVPYAFFSPSMTLDPLTFNIMYLLLLGIGAMKLWDLAVVAVQKKGPQKALGVLLFLAWWVYMWLPNFLSMTFHNVQVPFLEGTFALRFSYGTYGLFMVMIFYWFQNRPIPMALTYLGLSVAMPFLDGFVAYGHYVVGAGNHLTLGFLATYVGSNFKALMTDIANNGGGLLALKGFFFQSRSLLGLMCILALAPLNWKFKMPRWFGYWFYPVHMSLLLLLKANPWIIQLLF